MLATCSMSRCAKTMKKQVGPRNSRCGPYTIWKGMYVDVSFTWMCSKHWDVTLFNICWALVKSIHYFLCNGVILKVEFRETSVELILYRLDSQLEHVKLHRDILDNCLNSRVSWKWTGLSLNRSRRINWGERNDAILEVQTKIPTRKRAMPLSNGVRQSDLLSKII